MNKLFFAVVIYNKKICDSVTCTELENIIKTEKVIIADNSDKENDAEKVCSEKKWIYISMNGNKGLSMAYNTIIDYIKKKEDYSEEDAIILLDDDTKITSEYILKLKEMLEMHNDINIFMPIIKDKNNIIISPSEYTKLKINKIRNYKEAINLKREKFLAINTCLAIRMKIFNSYAYDTKLFLDQVDNQFFYDMRKKGEKFLCINSVIKQDFFSTDNKDYNKEIIRRKIEKRDYKNFVSDKSILEKIMYYFRVLFWKVRGCIKYRRIKYFIDLK